MYQPTPERLPNACSASNVETPVRVACSADRALTIAAPSAPTLRKRLATGQERAPFGQCHVCRQRILTGREHLLAAIRPVADKRSRPERLSTNWHGRRPGTPPLLHVPPDEVWHGQSGQSPATHNVARPIRSVRNHLIDSSVSSRATAAPDRRTKHGINQNERAVACLRDVAVRRRWHQQGHAHVRQDERDGNGNWGPSHPARMPVSHMATTAGRITPSIAGRNSA